MPHSETSLAQTIIATMRKLGPAPEVNRPEILVNVKDLEAVIEEHLDEYLARDRDETPPPHVMRVVEDEIARVVQSVNEWDDRTSPDDYPEHLLMTSEELADILRNFEQTLSLRRVGDFK